MLRIPLLKTGLAAGLIASSLLAAFPALAEASEQWVRIKHRADLPALRETDLRGRLDDYGSFQWGRLKREQVERLRQRGLSVAIERAPFELTLGGERFDPLEIATPAAVRRASPDGDFHVLQFKGPIRPEWLRSLRARGIELVQPLHPFSYVVWAPSARMNEARALASVRWSGLMRPEWKVPPSQRFSEPGVHPTMALASAHADPEQLRKALSAFGHVGRITPLNRHYRIVHMHVDRRDYSRIAELAGIYTVQYIPPEAGPRGEMSNQSIVGGIDGSGVIQPGYGTWLSNGGFDGSGIKVGIVDGPVLSTHQDLADRMTPCLGSNGSCGGTGSDPHGTHVAGAVAGTGATGVTDGGGFLRGQGVAPGTSLVSQVYGPFLDGSAPSGMVAEGMLGIFRDSADSGVLLTNNSWGPTGSPQGYDIPTQQVDIISRDADPDTAGNQPVLAVWSVMNGNGDASGACAPSSLGSPDEAKNLFAVGSTALQDGSGNQRPNIYTISSNSAHGPACDGRRVPHIVAPGCYTDSTSNSSDTAHAYNCGTSMASPVVSGAVAVWAEKYLAQTGTKPSPALVKAVFTAAARDLQGETNADGAVMGHRPDRFQGYGRLDLEAVMNPGTDVFLHDQATLFDAPGQTWSQAFDAVDPAQPMRVMLAWTDAPGHGMGGTTPAWVNNLDLDVWAGGDTYFGNVIGPDGWSATGGETDDRNNLEGVFLNASQHGGTIGITVTAADLAGDALDPYNPDDPSQDFALVCYNCAPADPTFRLSTTPDSLDACIPDSGSNTFSVDVAADAIGAYSGNVGFSSSGEPAGVTASGFNPANVTLPGTGISAWSVEIDSSATPATSTLVIEGDDGVEQRSIDFALSLVASLDSGPSPLSPADGAVDVALAPELTWNSLADSSDYRLQVATDSGFGSPVIDETLFDTTFTPAGELASDTTYYWRVRGNNACGAGAWSTTRSFTTIPVPEATLSPRLFDFRLFEQQVADQTLSIDNSGTGSLDWQIATREATASLPGRSTHDPALDETLQIPDFDLPGAGSASHGSQGGVATSGQVIGFTFQGTVTGISGTGTYASDMALSLASPDGKTFSVGGYATAYPTWDFQGSASSSDGVYTSTHTGTGIFGSEGAADYGNWQFDFEHTFEEPMDWSAVTITLHKQAPPQCDSSLASPAWLDVSPTSGSVTAGNSQDVAINVDTNGLSPGSYSGYLCVTTNDQARPLVAIEVQLDLRAGIFADAFEG